MGMEFTSLGVLLDHGFDTVIDVRSPAEYAEDHLPGAINLPVLNDTERAEVGTIYVQESPFLARKLGAAMVFRNAARHIEGPLSHHDGAWRPLVYCWRGGQRSGAFRWMLEQIGWRAAAIEGGYRTYRSLVHSMLYDTALEHHFLLLDGYTGTAKTETLQVLASRGRQVLDLEDLAAHRGSLLGATETPQPEQKMFESRIATALARFDPEEPVLVEAESNKIGARIIPPTLWAAMKTADRVEISADLAARTGYLLHAYDDVLSNGARLRALLTHLREVRGHAVVDGWFDLIDAGDKRALTRALIEEHYDPAYAASRRKRALRPVATVRVESLDHAGIASAADMIERLLDQVPRPLASAM
ncbi:MAG: tRNA 2-selenouridine(34) synthase MnmH [Pseudomonadota bacterium]